MKKAIVLLSGGMDSSVTLALAMREHEVYPLHVNYRHKTEKRELQSFKKLVSFYRLKMPLIVDVDYLRNIGGSSLFDESIELEHGKPKAGEIPASYVPFRNTHLLAIAVSYAEVKEASSIFIGVVEQDSSGYPDCRVEYIEAFNNLVRVGSKAGDKIKVYAPLIRMNKREIVEMGAKLKVPFQYTWSCYTGNNVACGECQSCYLRLKAFAEAGVKDRIKYKSGVKS